jgi:trk system potassium uptake protein
MPSIAVIGIGSFGSALARELQARGAEVLAIDTDSRHLDEIGDAVAAVAKIDGSDPSALRRMGIADMDMVVVAIGESFIATQECVLALRSAGARKIIARAQSHDRRRILELIGADLVVAPEEEFAKRVAYRLIHPIVLDSVDLGDGIEVVTIPAPPHLVAKSLQEARPRSDYNILVLRIRRGMGPKEPPQIIVPPGADTVLQEGDHLTIVGRAEDISRFSLP